MAGQVLRLSKISFENYRPFKKMQIDFKNDKEKTMTIISGNNSRGKTSIMNGIHWCLYNTEPFWLNEGEGKPIINQQSLNETALNNSTFASVSVEFSDDKGPRYEITRKLYARRLNDTTEKIFNSNACGQIDAGFSITQSCEYTERKKDGSWFATDDEKDMKLYVNKLLPEDLAQFVIFNGEMLDKFFRKEGSNNIKDGIERVSGLPITENAIDHAAKLVKQYSSKEAKNSGPEGTIIEQKKVALEQILEQLEGEQRKDETELKELQVFEDKYSTALSKFPEQYIKGLREQLEREKDNKKTIESARESLRTQRSDLIISNLPKMILKDVLLETKEILRESELRKETPPVITPEFIDERLSEGRCMCGYDLSHDPEATQKLTDLKNSVKNSEIANIANEGKVVLASMKEYYESSKIKELLTDLAEQLNTIDEKQTQSDKTIQSIVETLKEHNEEEIKEIGSKLDDILIKKRKVTSSMDKRDVRIESAMDTIRGYQSDIDRLSKLSKASQMWTQKREFAEKVTNTLRDIREQVLAVIRKDVESRTEELWKSLIARGKQVEKVEIDDNYKIRVIDKEGIDNLRTLSAGQTLYLALSFIAAVREVTDTNYPMIIDSPFGKVDGPARVLAAQILPRYLPDTQITLLVTDSEYAAEVTDPETNEKHPSIRNVLMSDSRIWKEFTLKLHDTSEGSSETIVKEV